jgi:hypothetical protein
MKQEAAVRKPLKTPEAVRFLLLGEVVLLVRPTGCSCRPYLHAAAA